MQSKRNKSLNIRLSKVEKLKLRLKAEIKGKTISELIREIASN